MLTTIDTSPSPSVPPHKAEIPELHLACDYKGTGSTSDRWTIEIPTREGFEFIGNQLQVAETSGELQEAFLMCMKQLFAHERGLAVKTSSPNVTMLRIGQRSLPNPILPFTIHLPDGKSTRYDHPYSTIHIKDGEYMHPRMPKTVLQTYKAGLQNAMNRCLHDHFLTWQVTCK